MSMIAHRRLRRGERGLSLFEMLLTVGIISTFLLFVIQIGQEIAREQAISGAANYVLRVDKALEATLSNPQRFRALYNQANAQPSRMVEATVGMLRNNTGVFFGTQTADILNDNFPNQTTFNQTFRILLRAVDNAADPNDPPALATYLLSTTMINDTLVTRIASKLGGGGGALRNTADPLNGTIRGTYATWQEQVPNLILSGWAAGLGLNPPPTIANGGYVAYYHRYDIDRIAKDYLYRNDVGYASLNRMNADLSLGNYNLMGADDVTVTNALTGREAYVKSSADLQNVTISNTLQADSRAQLGGNITGSVPAFNFTIDSSRDAGGAIVAPSTLAIGALTTVTNSAQVENTATIKGNLDTPSAIGNVGVIDGNLNVAAAQGMNARVANTGLTVSGNTTVNSGTLRAADLNSAGAITVSGGQVGMVDLQTGNLSVSNGTSGINGGSLRALSIQGTANVNTFGACNAGC